MKISNTELMAKPDHNPRYVPPGYDPGKFERPSLTTDAIILTVNGDELETLLIQRGNHPYKDYWALPGGFASVNETVESSCLRELEEETGLKDVRPQLLGVYSDPGRDPRTWVVSVAYYALIPWTAVEMSAIQAGDDARNAGWAVAYPEKLPDLAFDHGRMLRDAVEDIRKKAMVTSILWPLFAGVHRQNGGLILNRVSTDKSEIGRIYRAVFNSPNWGDDEICDRLRSRGVIKRQGEGFEFV